MRRMLSTHLDFPDPHDAQAARMRLRFGPALRHWVAWRRDEVHGVLDAVEQAARAGRWCVGGLAYEAAAAFDKALPTHAPLPGVPLAWFAEYAAPLSAQADAQDGAQTPAPVHVQWQGEADDAMDRFDASIARIHEAIAAGECYQINFTQPLKGTLFGTAQDLFAALKARQPDGYVLAMRWAEQDILSLSPELFFDWDGEHLLTRPMKGTAARGADAVQDAAQAAHLRTSPKERAENVMIVDLLRNDVSRIAQPHSVQVPRLFHVEALPTLWQMTSDVTARTRAGTRLVDVFGALFPCGSITGAPKVQAMHWIKALEPEARGVYCGALGVVRPGAQPGALHATFNVPIRTLTVAADQHVRCGIGSGITASAHARAEWQEWQDKRAFIDQALPPLQVLETLALVDGAWQHAEHHLARMQASARFFGMPWNATAVSEAIAALRAAHADGWWRVRWLLGFDGRFEAQAFAMADTLQPVRLQLAVRAFAAAHSPFVRHKTTRRAHYAAFEPQADSGVFDTILWNERGEITECTRGNICMQMDDGAWVTPAIECGLLPGVGRAIALQSGRVREAVVRVDDLPQIRAWAFVNSLRGWLDAQRVQ